MLVIIDFTTTQSTLKNVLLASELQTPIVIGTTGLDERIIIQLKNVLNMCQYYNHLI